LDAEFGVPLDGDFSMCDRGRRATATEVEMRIFRGMAVWLAAVGLWLGAAAAGQAQRSGSGQQQQQQQQQVQQQTLPGLTQDDSSNSLTKRTQEELEKGRNADRQKKLVEDTQRLLALANELKVQVDKSNKDTLSLDVIRKADEIEKLAHSVKEKMKGT
jgi:hypothetical protein